MCSTCVRSDGIHLRIPAQHKLQLATAEMTTWVLEEGKAGLWNGRIALQVYVHRDM